MRAAVFFSGAAGTSIGARDAGAEVVFAANHSPVCVAVHAANFPNAANVCQDLHLFNHAAMPVHDILLASPVCRASSSASRPARAKAKADPVSRAKAAALASAHNSMRALPWAIIDALEVNRPQRFVLENVKEFATEWELYRDFLRLLRRLGYKLSEHLLNAIAFGVPQDRLRLFVVGTMGRRPIRIREPKQWAPRPMHDFVDWDGGEWLDFDECQHPKMREQLSQAHAALRGRHPGFIQLVGHRPVWPSTEPLGTMTRQDQFRWVHRGRYRTLPRASCSASWGFPRTT